MLSYMECFSSVTAASQSEPVLFPECLINVCKQIQAWQNSRRTKLSSLFSQKHFLDTWLFKVLLRPKMHLSFSPQMLKVLTLSNKFAKS